VKIHIELTKEQADELFAEATDGLDAKVRERLRQINFREIVKAAVDARMPS
jgi:hypothetical protein